MNNFISEPAKSTSFSECLLLYIYKFILPRNNLSESSTCSIYYIYCVGHIVLKTIGRLQKQIINNEIAKIHQRLLKCTEDLPKTCYKLI